jgi:signal transduction histidine kinase
MVVRQSGERGEGAGSTRWGREVHQRWQYGLGAVMLGVLLPVAAGHPNPKTTFGVLAGEVTLAISLTVLFAGLLLVVAGLTGGRARELWFALAGLALIAAHPMLDSFFGADQGWLWVTRVCVAAAAVIGLTFAVGEVGWFGRVVQVLAVGLAGVAIVGAAVAMARPAESAYLDVAIIALSGAAAAIGGINFILGQRFPDGAVMSVGMSALSVGYGGLLQLSSGGDQLTVGVATVSVVAGVAAVAASFMAVFEAVDRREVRRDALDLARSLELARLMARTDRYAEVAHDQRTALLAIEAAAQRMQSHPSGDLAAAVAAEAARLNRQLADNAAEPQMFNLGDALVPMLECMRTLGQPVGLVAADDVEVWGSIDDVVEIVGVLLENAYSHGAGPVQIEVLVRDEQVCLRVVDRGPGVPQPLRESIFERGVTTAPGAHSGLGLFSARRLAVAAGGELAVADGQHSVFELVLPREANVAKPSDDLPVVHRVDPHEDAVNG